MSRYDGLIIPRSYSEYINKTDAATLQQALQLSGVLSGAVAAGDNKAVKSSAVNTALATKQDKLTFDTTPTAGSTNPVTSGGVANSLSKYVPIVTQITFESIVTTTESENCTYTVIDKLCIVNLAAITVTGEGTIAKNLPKAKIRANEQWPYIQGYVPIFYIDTNSTTLHSSQKVDNPVYTQLIYPIAE